MGESGRRVIVEFYFFKVSVVFIFLYPEKRGAGGRTPGFRVLFLEEKQLFLFYFNDLPISLFYKFKIASSFSTSSPLSSFPIQV